jgi:hypothetical protein
MIVGDNSQEHACISTGTVIFGNRRVVRYSFPITVKSKPNVSIPVVFAVTDKVKVS